MTEVLDPHLSLDLDPHLSLDKAAGFVARPLEETARREAITSGRQAISRRQSEGRGTPWRAWIPRTHRRPSVTIVEVGNGAA